MRFLLRRATRLSPHLTFYAPNVYTDRIHEMDDIADLRLRRMAFDDAGWRRQKCGPMWRSLITWSLGFPTAGMKYG